MRYKVYKASNTFPTIAEFETLEAAYFCSIMCYLMKNILTGIWDMRHNDYVSAEQLLNL